MGDKLREEIESILRDAEYMAHCGKEIESILQRALTELDKGRWIPVEEKLPEKDARVLVMHEDDEFVDIDSWIEWRESPVSFSTATVSIGEGWADHDHDEITHWKPID